MTRPRGLFVFIAALLFAVIPSSAQAATTDFRIFLDVDDDVASGCTISGMAGIDQILVTRLTVGESSARVSRTYRQACSSATGLGEEIEIDGAGWPAGFQPASGNVLVETRIPTAAFGTLIPERMHVGVQATSGGATHTAVTAPGGALLYYPAPSTRRRRSAASPGSERVIALDGSGDDWSGLAPFLDGIASSGSPSLRIVKVYAFAGHDDDEFLYFRFDANLSSDAPFANDDTYTRPAGDGLTVAAPGVLSNDGDPNGLPLTALPVSAPANGSVTLNPDGSFTYTPADAASTATDSFEYKASNGTKDSNAAQVRIRVSTVANIAPVGVDDSYAGTEDTVLGVGAPGVLTNDTDVNGDPLTAALLAAPSHGTVVLNANGGFTYTPAGGYFGADSFTYTVSDGTLTDTATVSITVASVNDAPTVHPATFAIDENRPNGTTVGTVTVSDPDSADSHTFSITAGNTGGAFSINATSGTITVANSAALDFEVTPQFLLTVRVVDSGSPARSDTATVTINVNDLNEAPVAADQSVTTDEDTAVSITLAATDQDGDAVTYAIVTAPAHGALTGAAPNVTYTPAANYNGPDSFTFRANDGALNSNLATVSITVTPVNDVPVAAADAYSTDEDVPLVVPAASGVLANDTDVEGPLTAILVSGTTNGAVTLNADGSFSYTPNANFNGSDSFSYKANDGTADSNTVVVTITVNAVNDAPVAVGDAFSTSEDTPLSVPAAGVLANDTDAEATPLTAVLVSDVANGTLALNVNGSFNYTPNANFNGSDSFTYKANDGALDSNTVTVTITVNAVNDVPVATGDAYATDEDVPLVVAAASGVLANDTDVEGPITAVLVSGTTNGAVTLNADGSFSYTPNANFNGADSFSYKANDGTADSNTVVVTITVNPVNDAPVFTSSAVTTATEDSAYSYSVATADVDAGATLTITASTKPAWMTLTDNGDGTATLSGTPLNGDVGGHAVVLEVSDGIAAAVQQSFTITVANTNDAPTFTSTPVTSATEDSAYNYGITTSDIDVGDTLAITASVKPAWLTVTDNGDGTATLGGTPLNDDVGSNSVTLDVNDGTVTVQQSFTITVANTNDAPTFTSAAVTAATEDSPYGYSVTTADVDAGATLTITASTKPAWLTLTDNGDGTASLSGTPLNGDVGANNVVLEVTDGMATVQQSFTITVANTNDAPTFTSAPVTSATEDSAYNYSITTDDVDAGDTRTITASVLPAWLTLTDNGDGTATLAGMPLNDDVGPHNVTLDVNDGDVNVQQSFTITVANTNDAPTFTSAAVTAATEDSPYSYSITTADVDVGATLAITASTLPSWLSITDNGDGTATLSGTPLNGDVGSNAVVLEVSDGIAAAVQQSFTISVANTNDAPSFTSSPVTSATEDSAYTYVVATSDPDVGDTLTITAPTKPTWLTITDNGDGTATLSGTPLNGDVGSNSVTLEVNDGTVTVQQSFTITVANTNDAPTFTSAPVTSATEDSPYSYAITTSDVDAGATLTITASTKPAWLTITDNGDGTASLTGTPLNGDVGPNSVVLEVSDGIAPAVQQSFTITVINTNDAPSFTSSPVTSATEDSAYTYNVTTSDIDVGDTLTVTAPTKPTWLTITDNGDGTATLSGTPLNGDVGVHNVTLEVNDGTVAVQQSFTITVANTNDAPTFTSAPVTSATEDSPYSYAITTSDVDAGATLTITASTKPAWLTITDNGDGTASLTGTPLNGDVGPNSVVLEVSDGIAPAVQQSFTISVANTNDAPSFTSSPVTSATEDGAYSYSITTSDIDVGDTLTITAPTKPTWLTITDNGDGTATLSGTPLNGDVGSNSVTLEVNDGTVTVQQSFTITVANTNDAPTFTSTAVTAATEDSAYSYSVTTADVDAGATLTITASTKPAWLTLTDNGDGTASLTGTPLNGDVGPNSVVLEVSDGIAPAVQQSFTITVANSNDAPSFTSSPVTSATEDSAYSYSITTSDIDVGDTLTITASTLPSWLTVTDNGDGTASLSGTPLNDDVGTHNVTLDLSDGTVSVQQSFTITVANTNDAPTFTSAAVTAATEDSAYSYSITTADVDVGATLTITAPTLPAWLSFTDNGDGTATLSGTPLNGDVGSNAVVLEVSDGIAAAVQQSFTISVANTNDAPSFTSSPVTSATEDSAYTYSITTSDIDVGDTLTITASVKPAWLTVTDNGDGTAALSGTPLNDDVGSNSVTLDVNDGTVTVQQSFTITVANTNDAPVAADDSGYSVDEGGTLNAATVLTNDTDVDTGASLTAATVTLPAHASSFTFNSDGTFSYTHDGSETTTDSFTYHANDGTADSNDATVTITITTVNDAPVNTVPGAQATNEDTNLTFTGGNAISVSDVDAGAGDVEVTLAAVGGTITLDAADTGALSGLTGDGTNNVVFTGTVAQVNAAMSGMVFSPTPDSSGAASLSITTSDQGNTGTLGGTQTAGPDTVAITINAVNDNPVVTLSGGTPSYTEGGAAVEVDNALTISDVDSTTLTGATVTITNLLDNGQELLAAPTLPGGITASYVAPTLTLSHATGASLADFQAALRAVTYENTSTNPNPTQRTIDIQVDDGAAANNLSVVVTVNLDVVSINSKPVVTPSAGTTAFVEDAGAVAVDSAVTVADPDTATLIQATVKITNLLDGTSEVLAAPSLPGGITASYSSATGTLTLSHATGGLVADFETALRAVTYQNTSHNPTTTTRVIEFQLDDGQSVDNLSDAATKDVSVTARNDAPAGTDNSASIDEEQVHTFTVADFGFSDPLESPANNLLAVKITTLPALGTLTLSGGPVLAGAFISEANITAGNLVFTPATNGAGSPYASFTFQVQDDGGTANGGVDVDPSANTFTFNVANINDAPAGTNKTVTALEDTQYTFTVADFGFTDPNDTPANALQSVVITTLPALGTLTLSGSGFAAGTEIAVADITTGNLKFQPASNGNGLSYTAFTFQVRDDGGTTNGGVDLDASANTITIDVTSVNDAPAGTDKTVTTNEDVQYTFAAADFGFTDPNDSPANALQSVVITTLPGAGSLTLSGVGFAAGTDVSAANITSGLLKFVPAANDFGSAYATFTFQVRDNGGTANGGVNLDPSANTITVDVNAVNDAPVVAGETHDTMPNVTLEVSAAQTQSPAFFVSGTVLSNDNFGPANEGPQTLTISAVQGGAVGVAQTTVQGGQVTMNADGTYIYVPQAGDITDDSFTYTVKDNGGTANGGDDSTDGTVTIDFKATTRTWFVKNDAPAGGSGVSTSPFNTLAAAAAPSSDGDIIFVYRGDGTSTGQNAGFALKRGQNLWGETIGLKYNGVTVNAVANPTLVSANAANRPVVAGAITLTDVLATDTTEVIGFSLSSSTDVFNFTTAAATTGALKVDDNVITGSTNQGIKIAQNGAGTTTADITNNSWTGASVGNAIDIVRSAGSLRLNISSNTNVTSSATAIAVNGGAVASSTITGFSNNSVSGNSTGMGALITNVTFDADTVTAGVQQVVANAFAVGASGNPVGTAGVQITNAQGNVFFSDLDVFAASGTALQLSGTGTGLTFGVQPTSSGGTSSIDADSGAALDISTAAVDLRLASLDSTTTATGVTLTTVSGQVAAAAGLISKSSGAGTAFTIASSSATVDMAARLNITSGAGVSLTSNTGTMSFTGGLTLTTAGNAAFVATGGGTVNVTDPPGATNNTISTTTGAAVNISGTTIGGSGVTFESVAHVGNNTAINLATTGAGTFIVTGVGTTAGSGGTIQNIVGSDAVVLNTTGGLVTLKNMIIQDITAGTDGTASTDIHSNVDAIHGQTVNGGLTLDRVTIQRISDNGINGTVDGAPPTATVWSGLTLTSCTITNTNRFNTSQADANNEGAVFIKGIRGTVSVTGSTFSNAGNGLILWATAGTLDATIQSNSFTTLYKEIGTLSIGNFGIDIVQQGTATSTIRIGDPAELNGTLGNTFTNGGDRASIRVISDTGATGAMKSSVSRNTFTVTDHSSPGVPAGSTSYNFPQGGILLRAMGTGNYEAIFAGNTLTQLMHADGGLGMLSIIAEKGASEFIVRNNTFDKPWDAPLEVRADGAAGGQTSAQIQFTGNAYIDGIVGDGSTDLGGQSPYDAFYVQVRNGGKMDFTMQNEATALGLTDTSSAHGSFGFYAQTTSAGDTFNLFLQNIQSPRGYRLSQPAGTYNLFRNGSGGVTAQAVLQDNGNRGGAGVDTTNPPAVTVSGTITLTNVAPALPSISQP